MTEEQKRVENIIARVMGQDIKEGGVYMMTCYHDDWCPKLKGGECRCNPDLKMKELNA